MWLVRSLWAGASLLVALTVAASLWWLLGALGDTTGARIAKGISLGLAICWGINLVGVIVLVALGQLETSEPPPEPDESPSEIKSDARQGAI